MWRPRFWKNRVTMQHATFGAWEFFFSLCFRDRFVVILMIFLQYLEPINSSFATTKKTKKNLQTPFATGPEDSPEDILRRFEIKSVLLSSWIEEHWLFCYSIFINTSTTSTTGLARASTARTQATGRLYLHLQRFRITLLCSFFLFFNTRLDYICAFLFFPEWSLHRSSSTPCWRWTPARDWPPIRSFHIRCILVGLELVNTPVTLWMTYLNFQTL